MKASAKNINIKQIEAAENIMFDLFLINNFIVNFLKCNFLFTSIQRQTSTKQLINIRITGIRDKRPISGGNVSEVLINRSELE